MTAASAGRTIPEYASAAIDALRFEGRSRAALSRLGEGEWRDLLAFADRAQLTLLLGRFAADALPPDVRERIRRNTRDYRPRFERLGRSMREIARALELRGIDFAVLKGAAYVPDFTPEASLRAQSDIDLWCPPERVLEARDAVAALGFRQMGESPGRHLPPMVREKAWTWTGDYFAGDLPIPVELHYELWDDSAEFIRAPGVADFWRRRVRAPVAGLDLPVLAPPDALGFACLHLLMHILHGDLRLARAWEVARFVHRCAADGEFWERWRALHPAPLRRLEAVTIAMAASWFNAALAPALRTEIAALPPDVRSWLDRSGFSPVESLFRSCKDEIWLHLALLDSVRARRAVFLRRVFPAHAVAGTQSPRHAARRIAHHLQALGPALAAGIRWRWRRPR